MLLRYSTSQFIIDFKMSPSRCVILCMTKFFIPRLRSNMSFHAKIAFQFNEVTSRKGYKLEEKEYKINGWDRCKSYSPRLLSQSIYMSLENSEKGNRVVFNYLHM